MADETSSNLDTFIEDLRMRFMREGFEFDDIDEIGIYKVELVPYRRHLSSKRDQREFNALPITYWDEIDPVSIEDYSRSCYQHYTLQERNIMRTSMDDYALSIFPVIVSPNVDSIALSSVQRYSVNRGNDIEFPIIYDLDLGQVYMRRFNPGKGDPYFHPFYGEIVNLLKG